LGYEAEGIELCSELAEITRVKNFNVRSAPDMELDDPEKYDVVTAKDIIEHIPDPLALLRAAHRSLKSGLELIVYTPNHRAAVVTLAKLLAAGGLDFAFRNVFGGNHVYFLDDRTLMKSLRSTGFHVRDMWTFPYDARRPGMEVSPLYLRGLRSRSSRTSVRSGISNGRLRAK
jgi:2-polyprenyl-6-hydroxyphenyl methylase / 3-demethylubiquinone-9 3-methyltransferase